MTEGSTTPLAGNASNVPTSTRGAVLVTGASSGIGRACALGLRTTGYDVFATVRSDTDAEDLTAHDARLHVLQLDVNDDTSVEAAATDVREATSGRGLVGLVNNAGIALGGPLEYLPLRYWRDQLDVNVVGQVAVTRAMIPLLRSGNGRIVFIGSISGRLSTPLLGPYCASKAAIDSIADALRNELWPWRIPVSLVEPGGVKTQIWTKARSLAAKLEEDLPARALADYSDAIENLKKGIDSQERSAVPPERVAQVVARALEARRPRARYVVGLDARIGGLIARFVPARARDYLVRNLLGP